MPVGARPVSILTIVDTDILIDAGQGVQEAVECLADIMEHSVPAVSVITQMELLVGCRDATALSLNQPFISKNQRDYRFIKGLQLLPYPQPSHP
jgi:predicted nucleic acid-binding protein